MGISDYAVFGNNSNLYTDVLGDEIDITHRKGFLGKKERLSYRDGKLFNKDGSDYKGEIKGFLKKTFDALREIKSTKEGSSMLAELESSKNMFHIENGNENKFSSDDHIKAHANEAATTPEFKKQYDKIIASKKDISGGSGGTVSFSKADRNGLVWEQDGKTDKRVNRSSAVLAHELFHALDANRGLLDSRQILGLKKSEWQATYRENQFRMQMNFPLRTYYKTVFNLGTRDHLPLAPKLLDESNNSIPPDWYKP